MEEYADWLAAQLERLGGPGRSRRARLGRRVRGPGGLDPARSGPVLGHRRRRHRRRRVRVARLRQDLADPAGGGRLLGPAAGGTGRGAGRCLPDVRGARGAALDLASHINRTMADCILDLYRSAVDVGRQWGPDFAAIPAPGLVIIPSEEPFMRAASSTRAAAGPAPGRPPSTGSATGGCSRTRPGQRPSCANSGPPWPDPPVPERAGAPAGIRLNLIAITGHGLRARAPGATAGVLFRFRRGQALAIGAWEPGGPPSAAATSPASADVIPRAPRRPVDLDRHPVGVGSRSGQVKRHVRAGAGEQPRALAENHAGR